MKVFDLEEEQKKGTLSKMSKEVLLKILVNEFTQESIKKIAARELLRRKLQKNK